MKKIIIIGATGSTGLYLTEHLSKKNKIFATGYKKRTSNYYKKRGIEYINIDISNKNDFNKLPKEKDNIDALILLAGLMPARMKGYNPYKYIEINTIGTLNLFFVNPILMLQVIGTQVITLRLKKFVN